ncbi:MAG TPA: anthranilate synthase component I [Ktedonobacterales bacterium]|nr:anthranilate synthase component I [Ktedonobacterales bacterium]
MAATPPRTALTPIWRDVPADMDTPVSAYRKLARGPYSYLLESVEGGERLARYSFVGTEPYLVLKVRGAVAELRWLAGRRAGTVERVACDDPLALVEGELRRRACAPMPNLAGFSGGAVGYLGYEAASGYEPTVPAPAADPLDLPLAIFMFCDTVLAFDHVRHSARLITHLDLDASDGDEPAARVEAVRRLDALERRLRGPLPRSAARAQRPAPDGAAAGDSRLAPRAAYKAAVERAKDAIRAGECYQIVPSRRLARPTSAPPFEIYRALRSLNPSPYMFYLTLDDVAIAGASPELLVRVERGEVAVHPIAGTRRRGATPAEDAALAAELRADEKERAEHMMLVDLGRNDVGRVAEPGSVRVEQLMDVERYSHVMHLVSHVTGRLRADRTPFDALRAGFPAGTVTGAPKVRAMQVLAELEGERRGVYAGAIGHFGFDGDLDTCIALRTLVLKGGVAYAQAGGGVVYDSTAAAEFAETENKLRAALAAIEEAEKRCSS